MRSEQWANIEKAFLQPSDKRLFYLHQVLCPHLSPQHVYHKAHIGLFRQIESLHFSSYLHQVPAFLFSLANPYFCFKLLFFWSYLWFTLLLKAQVDFRTFCHSLGGSLLRYPFKRTYSEEHTSRLPLPAMTLGLLQCLYEDHALPTTSFQQRWELGAFCVP